MERAEARRVVNEKLLGRIKRLEEALSRSNLPCYDAKCKCCGITYIPLSYDSIRCNLCCQTCRYNTEEKVWVKGFLCPNMKHIQY